MKPIKVGIKLFGIDTFDINKQGNIQGDELIGRGWQKYLARHEQIDRADIYGAQDAMMDDLDVVIHFNPFLDLHPTAKNILYLQNAFPKEAYPGGTVGVFHQIKDRFDGHIYTSKRLQQACGEGVVVEFATDPEFFQPQPAGKYDFPVSFVGNGIRSPYVNQRYIAPALPFNLVIYGNMWEYPFSEVWQGKLPMPDLPTLYSDCSINLNAHIAQHAELDTINLRIYDILACGGFVLSDHVDSLVETFGDLVPITDGYEDEWAKITYYLSNPEARKKKAEEGRKLVLSNHSYEYRMETVGQYLKEIL
ncbi:glycosyltransferase [Calothrix rhizosoleniae]|uniref:glycosyltransferase family protein n=1 Tax=Calothrix rhizosoleniae TaxID=888997 RepID=UPI000B497014|nr:glycosyltransferase [Calothrix rhizosoleniae]